jgi:hypothetical protein
LRHARLSVTVRASLKTQAPRHEVSHPAPPVRLDGKTLKALAVRGAAYALIAWLLPGFALFYLVCGLYDVARNSQLDGYTIYQYFFGRGLGTWLLSPFNILMDIVHLPFWNKGVYRLEELPPAYQREIRSLIDSMQHERLVEKIETRLQDNPREMLFFKWYGQNIDGPIDIPEFRRRLPADPHHRRLGVQPPQVDQPPLRTAAHDHPRALQPRTTCRATRPGSRSAGTSTSGASRSCSSSTTR